MGIICDICHEDSRFITLEQHKKSGDCEYNQFAQKLAIEHPDYVCMLHLANLRLKDIEAWEIRNEGSHELVNTIHNLNLPHAKFFVEHKEYKITQLRGVWAPKWIYDAFVMFFANNGYAGLTLEEFLRKAANEQPAI